MIILKKKKEKQSIEHHSFSKLMKKGMASIVITLIVC